MMTWQTVSPTPVPAAFVEKNGSKMRPLSLSAIPTPVSSTVTAISEEPATMPDVTLSTERTVGDGGHRLQRVGDQIQKHLMQLTAVGKDRWKVIVQVRFHDHALKAQFKIDRGEHIPNDFVHVKQLPVVRAFLEHRSNAANDLAYPPPLRDNVRKHGAHFFQVRFGFRQLAQARVSALASTAVSGWLISCPIEAAIASMAICRAWRAPRRWMDALARFA